MIADVRSPQDASDNQGGGSMNEQEDLSDQSEGESYSYSATSGEPLSRDHSESLFDPNFQVQKILSIHYCSFYSAIKSYQNISISCFHSFNFLGVFVSPQTTSPATPDAPPNDTADLLGFNSDPQPPSVSSATSPPQQGDQGGMKTASSNSDLLNELFAPPAGQTGAVQEDLFFSGPASGATPDQKRKD